MTELATELAWAAGLFDGEGSVRNMGNSTPMVAVKMSDLELLRRFHVAVQGLGTLDDKPYHRPGKPTYKPMFAWYACGAAAVQVAGLLAPIVGTRNKERFAAIAAKYAADRAGVCQQCGAAFERPHRDRKFCSKRCGDASRRPNVRPRQRVCGECGETFEYVNSRRRFCSRACVQRHCRTPAAHRATAG